MSRTLYICIGQMEGRSRRHSHYQVRCCRRCLSDQGRLTLQHGLGLLRTYLYPANFSSHAKPSRNDPVNHRHFRNRSNRTHQEAGPQELNEYRALYGRVAIVALYSFGWISVHEEFLILHHVSDPRRRAWTVAGNQISHQFTRQNHLIAC